VKVTLQRKGKLLRRPQADGALVVLHLGKMRLRDTGLLGELIKRQARVIAVAPQDLARGAGLPELLEPGIRRDGDGLIVGGNLDAGDRALQGRDDDIRALADDLDINRGRLRANQHNTPRFRSYLSHVASRRPSGSRDGNGT